MLVGLHYTAFRDAIREDSRQTTPSRGVTQRKKFAVEANVESRVTADAGELPGVPHNLVAARPPPPVGGAGDLDAVAAEAGVALRVRCIFRLAPFSTS